MSKTTIRVHEDDYLRMNNETDESKPTWLRFREILDRNEKQQETIEELEQRIDELQREIEEKQEDLEYRITTLEEYVNEE